MLSKYKIKTNLKYVVEEPEGLYDFLLKKEQTKSKNNLKSMLQRGSILVNNQIITQYNYALKKGDQVLVKKAVIYDKEQEEVLDILYEDEELIVIDKPSGLLSIASNEERVKTAYKMVMNYVKQHHHGTKLFIVHRLDRETSGILLFAKNERIKYALQEHWNQLVKKRGYYALVEGEVSPSSGTIHSWLKETKTLLVYSSLKHGDGKEAITHYYKINGNVSYTLLDVHIDTGRKNQIRVHMKDLGHSVVGDKKYGSTTNPIGRFGLHAYQLELEHPFSKQKMLFETSIPNDFLKPF